MSGIAFDLDGTLYPGRRIYLAMACGLFPSLRTLLKYQKARQSLKGLDFDSEAHLRSLVAEMMAGGEDSKAQTYEAWISKKFEPAFLRFFDETPSARPGFVELIPRLRGAGYRLAVISDYPWIDRRLVGLGFRPEDFHARIDTPSLGFLKPSEQAGQYLQAALGIPLQKTLMIGDRADTDFALAERMGMPFLGIKDTGWLKGVPWHSWPAVRGFLQGLTDQDLAVQI